MHCIGLPQILLSPLDIEMMAESGNMTLSVASAEMDWLTIVDPLVRSEEATTAASRQSPTQTDERGLGGNTMEGKTIMN
jgi:hypothetical protein